MFFFNALLLRIIKTSNLYIFLPAILLIFFCSFLAYYIEPETFKNLFNSFWWVMTTVTTVGYGDYYPISVAGKCLGIFLYIFGISLISVVISKVVDSIFVYKRKKEEGKLRYKGENHFVIIDWSKHADLSIQEILSSDEKVEIVLIDQLEKRPISHERVHYIQGDPIQKETLEYANITKSKAVFIFANESTQYNNYIKDTSYVDGKTLLIATSIERFFKDIYTIVEIKDKENIPNFTHIDIDEFIVGPETISRLAVRSAFNPGASKIISQLITSQQGDDLYEVKKKPHWKTYRDAFEALLEEGATLISDGEHLNINRKLDEIIPEESRLFVICNKDTYKKLAH